MAHDAENGPHTFGQRVRRARERKGQSRPVLAGLVGRSAEWVKAIENDRLGMPRLPLLLRLAEALGVDDLAALTGDERLTAATYTKAAHPSLLRVKDALTDYDVLARDEEPVPAAVLADRVSQAWQAWHGFGDHRSRVANVLPALLADLKYAAAYTRAPSAAGSWSALRSAKAPSRPTHPCAGRTWAAAAGRRCPAGPWGPAPSRRRLPL
jgi:transcriptional regulator with XRE-family HTH domain